MALPAINTLVPFIFSAPLQGAVSYEADTSFSWKGWWTGGYQEQKEKHLNDYFGFRADFVRLHNQLEYTLFEKLNARIVVEGKDHYLYEKPYIDSYYGNDFRSEKDLLKTAASLKKIQQALKARGKELLFVCIPGKATVFPQYIPQKLEQANRGTTNMPVMLHILDTMGIDYVDIYKWYLNAKDTLKYPFMTKYNTHWSSYGCALGMNEVIAKLEQLKNKDLPDMSIECIESRKYCDHDKEIMTALNLIVPLPEDELTCIPYLHINDSNKAKMTAYIFSDSFFWEPYSMGIPARVFEYFEFWYYGNQRWGNGSLLGDYTKDELKKAIDKTDVIILMGAEMNIDWYAWMFEDFYDVLGIKK